MSPREKMIAIGVGAVIALYAVNSSVIDPYVARLHAIDDDTATATATLNERLALFARQSELKKVWAAMTRGGLSADPSAAESLALKATLDWAGEAGVTITALKPDRVTDENQFQIISFHATASGSSPAVGKLLWDIETATIPVRLTDLAVTPRKEGTDDLVVQFGISTLCLRPGATDAAKPPTAAAGLTGGNAS